MTTTTTTIIIKIMIIIIININTWLLKIIMIILSLLLLIISRVSLLSMTRSSVNIVFYLFRYEFFIFLFILLFTRHVSCDHTFPYLKKNEKKKTYAKRTRPNICESCFTSFSLCWKIHFILYKSKCFVDFVYFLTQTLFYVSRTL